MKEQNVSKKPHFVPVRYTIHWCSAEENLDEAEISYGSVEDWIERGGGFVQGGSFAYMKPEDVVAGSPLDLDLRSARDGK